MLLPSALGFSPHPPVSVCGTGAVRAIAAFLGARSACFATFVRSTSRPGILRAAFPSRLPDRLCRFFLSRPMPSARVPTVLTRGSTGISTRRPSATCLHLALGPDLPRADQLYPGNLRYSAGRILTCLSLLIPAFSLRCRPPCLAGTASPVTQCSPTDHALRMIPRLRCRVSAPDIFGAGRIRNGKIKCKSRSVLDREHGKCVRLLAEDLAYRRVLRFPLIDIL